MKIKKIETYIVKNFLTKFLQVSGGFSLIIFFINFIEFASRSDDNVSVLILMAISFLKVPNFINDVAPSLVLMSTIASFYSLSSRSEITIIRASGYSLWQTIKPIALASFCLGIFWVTIFGFISIKMARELNHLESKYINMESRETFSPPSGIWLKQQNMQKPDEEIIIRANKIFRDSIEMDSVTLWFFRPDGLFYKKIDTKKMILDKDLWVLQEGLINDSNLTNQRFETITIPTNLQSEFIRKKVINNFENVKLFSIFELNQLIEDLAASGLNTIKFKVYLNSLLSKPIIFTAMTLIACYFGLSHFRNQKNVIYLFFGIVIGLVFYISASITTSLGSSGLIPIFISTWMVSFILLAIGTLLIYRKENL